MPGHGRMPGMAATTVLERASLRVVDYRCTEPPGAPGFVEHHGEHSLAYVRSGSFGYHSRGRPRAGRRLAADRPPGDEYEVGLWLTARFAELAAGRPAPTRIAARDRGR